MDTLPLTSTIVLLGAPGTGTHALAEALAPHLRAAPSPLTLTHSLLAQAVAAGDAVHVAAALQAHQGAQITLLMGLDLPCPAAEQEPRQALDAQLRATLGAQAIAYRVVYGQGPARLASALRALGPLLGNQAIGEQASSAHSEARAARLRAYGCEKCSDPVCEHRLFTALTRPPAQGCA